MRISARPWSLCVLLLALVCTQELVHAKQTVHTGGSHSAMAGAGMSDSEAEMEAALHMDAEKWNQTKWDAFTRLDTGAEGLLTKQEVMEGLNHQFDLADKNGTGMIDFDQFLGLDFEDPAQFAASRRAKREELDRMIDRYKKFDKAMHIFQTRSMGFAAGAVSLYLNVEVAEFFQKYGYENLPEEKMHEVLIRLIPCLILLMINAGCFVSILRRRLASNPKNNLKKPADKQIFCFYLIGLVFNIGTMFLCEPVWTKAIKAKIYKGAATETDAPKPYVTTALLAFFVFGVGFGGTYQHKDGQEDEFFIGVVRLIMVHLIIWVIFAWVMHANRSYFDGIYTFSDAVYFSMTVHTTIGYGDYSILKGRGRLICQLHASIVYYLNIVACYFLMVGAQEHKTDHDTGEQLKRMPGRNVARMTTGAIVVLYLMVYLMYKPPRAGSTDEAEEYGKYAAPTFALYIMTTLVLASNLTIKFVKKKSYKDDMLSLSASYLFWMIMTQLMCVEESYYVINHGTYKSLAKSMGEIGTTFPYFTVTTSGLFLVLQTIICLKSADYSFEDQEYGALAMMMVTNACLLYTYTVLYMHFRTHFGTYDDSTGELNIKNFDDALYFAAITQTTVGFGDISGVNDIVAQQLITSHAFATFIVGVASYSAVAPDTEDNEFLLLKNQKQTYYTPFMRYHGGKTLYQVAADKGIDRDQLFREIKAEDDEKRTKHD